MKNRILHNLGLKIGSIIVALLLWLTITNIDDPTVTQTFKNIPVQILHDEVISSRGYEYLVEAGDTVTFAPEMSTGWSGCESAFVPAFGANAFMAASSALAAAST